MPFKSLAVFLDGSDASKQRLDAALAIARWLDAHLTAVAIAEQPAYYYGIGSEVSADIYMQDVERAQAAAKALADAAGALITAAGVRGDVRWATGTAAAIGDVAARHARYADLALVGQPAEGDFELVMRKTFEGVLLESGRPLVVLPQGWDKGSFGKTIALAWSPQREAARAVSDAMPLIAGAAAVHVVVVDPNVGETAHGEEPGADLAATLSRQGVAVTVDQVPSAGQSVAECIHAHAVDRGADLIVMGGYGHWRLREALFGGVTRDMLKAARIPLMMSH